MSVWRCNEHLSEDIEYQFYIVISVLLLEPRDGPLGRASKAEALDCILRNLR